MKRLTAFLKFSAAAVFHGKLPAYLNNIMEAWRDEYRNMVSDFGVLSFFIVAQLVYPVLYPLPFYKGHENVRDVPVSVVDEDNSGLSRQFIRMLDASENLDVAFRSTSVEEAKNDLMLNRVRGIIVIPDGFSSDIYSNRQASVSAYCDASNFYLYKQVLGGVKYVAGYMSAGIQIQRLQAKGMSRPAALAARDPVPLLSYPLFNPSGSYCNYLLPVVLIIVLQQTLLLGVGFLGGKFYEERTYNCLLPAVSAEHGLSALILGKAGAYLSVFMIHSFYFFTVIFRFHGLPMKSDIFTLMVFIIPFLLASVFFALSVSTVFKTGEMAMLLLLSTSIPFVMLSGFSWPVFIMPQWVKSLAMLIPSTAGIDGFIKLSIYGSRLRDIKNEWLILWGLAAFYFIISIIVLKITIIKSSLKTGGN